MEKKRKLIDEFLKSCQSKGLDSKTIKAYMLDLKGFAEFSNDDLSKNVLADYLKYLKTRYKPATVKRKSMSLRAFYVFLVENNYASENPFWKLKNKFQNIPISTEILSNRCIKSIIDCAYATLFYESKTKWSKMMTSRDVAVLELLAGIGICVSEICELMEDDVDLKAQTLKIGKGTKKRTVKIVDENIIFALRTYKKHCYSEIKETGSYFINRLKNPLTDYNVRQIVDKYSVQAGYKGITPLNFRRTFAVNLSNNETNLLDIQKTLGHSSPAVTLDFVTVNEAKQEETIIITPGLKIFMKTGKEKI